MENTLNSPQSAPTLMPDSIRDAFRQCLRQADKFILEGNFEQAKIQIAEAKKLDKNNPFIIAFEERINLFANKISTPQPKPSTVTPSVAPPVVEEVTLLKSSLEQDQVSRDVLEQKLRQQIEAEYKTRFTQELHKAEELAAKILEEEREKLEQQGKVLKQKFDYQLVDARKQLEQEYQMKLDEEVAKAEERLEQQHHAELAFTENEMKTQLMSQYESELQHLRDKLKVEQEKVLENERNSFQDREQILKEQFNQKLLDSLRKAESVFQEQSLQQQQLERERIEQQLKTEFESRYADEKASFQKQYDVLKASLEESYNKRQGELNVQIEQKLNEQLEKLRKREEEKYDQRRTALRSELEIEFQKKYQSLIDEERKRVQVETENAIGTEKKKLDAEYNKLLQKQTEQVQKIRSDLRNEMEQTLLTRLERIAQEYDHKMELLGAKIPHLKEERVMLYRQKVYSCYESGQPSVDGARMLMQLKELLELTFDEHLVIESDVRMDLYASNVEKKILTGELNSQNAEALDKLKQQFNISLEESQNIEPYILSCYQRLATKGKLLVVDDDVMLLQMLQELLVESGYQVVTAPDIATALEKLKTATFDLILSDIKFGVDELDGFKFFKTIQEQPQWRTIPFVFMSALKDGVIVRSGVQLGVDDYLTKPMDPELLIATIEGKLKRFRHLQRN